MRILILPALVLLASTTALAGDCPSHPIHLYQVTIVSCSALDAENAMYVSTALAALQRSPGGGRAVDKRLIESRDSLIAKKAGVVVETMILRSRTLDVDDYRRGKTPRPIATAWETPKEEKKAFFVRLRGDPAERNLCEPYPKRATVVIAQPTSCECDTGPYGLCLLDERYRIIGVSAEYAEFAR